MSECCVSRGSLAVGLIWGRLIGWVGDNGVSEKCGLVYVRALYDAAGLSVPGVRMLAQDLVLRDVIAGRKHISLAISEPGAGSDVSNIATTAVRRKDAATGEEVRCTSVSHGHCPALPRSSCTPNVHWCLTGLCRLWTKEVDHWYGWGFSVLAFSPVNPAPLPSR